MAIMGFGGGALIASPLSTRLLSLYDPSYDSTVTGSAPAGSAVALLFLTFAVVHALFMSYGAATIRVPHPTGPRRVSTRRRSAARPW